VLFANRRLDTASPSILDLAPTVLKLLGVPLPADLDGRPLL
jgi:arylsulfatase A-like enzyme